MLRIFVRVFTIHVFLNFRLSMKDLSMFDVKHGLYVNVYVYIQVLRSVGLHLGQNIKKWLVPVFSDET